jgi:hypothetical protein
MMATMEIIKRAQMIRRISRFIFFACMVAIAGHASLAHTLPGRHSNDGNKSIDSKMVARSRGTIALKPEGVWVALEPTTGEARKSSLAARIGKLRNNRRLYLVIKDLHAENPPDVIYQVYLNLPKDKKPNTEETRAIGSVNFYASQYGAPRSDFFFSYDVTDTLKNLLARKLLNEPLIVTIIPTGEPAGESVPTIGQIQLIEQ